MHNFESKYEWSGKGFLIQNTLNLNIEVEYYVIFDLKEINYDDLIQISIKMAGSAIESPYNIPYENYTLKFNHQNINYKIDNMLMKEWKEVYLYSYSFKFTANQIDSENKEKANIVEFLNNDLVLGYNEMTMKDGEIINFTDINLKYKNHDYKIKITANPEFNNNKQFTNLDSKLSFTNKISFDLETNLFDLDDIENIYKDLSFLIGLAYGNIKENQIVFYYKDNQLIAFNLKKQIKNNIKGLAIIPYQFSGILSDYLNQVFENYTQLDNIEKKDIRDLAKLIFETESNINLPYSFIGISNLYEFVNEEPDFDIQEKINKYSEGDYKLFYSQINKFNNLLLSKLNYSLKYYDYSDIIPQIKE